MLINWEELDIQERISELREGFEGFEDRNQMETAFAILVNEFDLDLKSIIRTRNRLLELPGDPVDYIDDTTGELIIEEM